MEISEYAQQLLFGSTLSDKLIPASKLTDCSPGKPIALPDFPGRPAGLRRPTISKRSPFPTAHQLQKPLARAKALHFFANHELLAIELMALCLLRFPQAPPRFRRGLAHIISEEQEHLQIYLKHLHRLGGQLGMVPVNGFFWDSLKAVHDPLAFATGMGLTFEQANLDHSLYYMQLFRTIGDHESANALLQVYEDEIRHVRHGLRWVKEWSSESDTFQAHQQNLLPPLTIARAKGKIFDREGRTKAGLSKHYIDKLSLFSHSKGRPPRIFWFNPLCEFFIAQPQNKLPKVARVVAESLDILPMFLASQDDLVMLRQHPPEKHLHQLKSYGFPLPEFCTIHDRERLLHRQLGAFVAWGNSPRLESEWKAYGATWSPAHRSLYGKTWGSQQLRRWLDTYPCDWTCPQETIGQPCHTEQEVEAHISSLQTAGYSSIIIKAEWGNAGRNTIRVRKDWPAGGRKWLNRTLAQQKVVVVEPQHDKIIDFSIQLTVSPSGTTKVDGVHRFFTDQRGQYLGHWLGPVHTHLPTSLRRFLHGNGKDPHRWKKLIDRTAQLVGEALFQHRYTGPAGIDGLIYQQANQWFIRPIVEVNPRYTMGRIALGLQKHVSNAAVFWLNTAQKTNDVTTVLQHERKIQSGILALTPTDRPVVAMLAVGNEHTTPLLASWNVTSH